MGCKSFLLSSENVICTNCRHEIPLTQHFRNPENEAFMKFYGRIPIEHASTLLYFHKKGIVQEIIHGLKYHGHEEIGTVFQLADDIIDIASDSKESGKTPGTDLREGVPTLVTLFILESNDPADAELKKILSAPITDEAVVAQTILTLRNHSALTKSRELVAGYGRSAQKHLEILPEGPAKAALVGLSQAVISRTS